MAVGNYIRWIIWITCVFWLALTEISTQSGFDNLEKFCETRDGIYLNDKCFYVIKEKVSWNEARDLCRMPDQQTYSDLFYSEDEDETITVLQHFSSSFPNDDVWWTAANIVPVNEYNASAIWRGCNVPHWVWNDDFSQTPNYKIIPMQISLNQGNLLRLVVDERLLFPLCRYSPAVNLSCSGGDGGGDGGEVLFCDNESKYDIDWFNLTAGKEHFKPCPEESTGYVSWTCDENGKWIGDPDKTGCKIYWISDAIVIEKFDSTNKAELFRVKENSQHKEHYFFHFIVKENSQQKEHYTVYERPQCAGMNNSLVGSGSLSNATDQQDLETSDDVEALKNATEYLLYLYEKEIGTQQPENKANYTRIFLKSFTQIWSNSFESRNEGWNKMERNRRIEVAETAMTQLESVGRSLGCFSADSNGVTTNGIVLETFDLKSGEVLFKPSGLPELKVHLKSSQITSGCGNTKMVGVGIAYVDLAPLLLKLTEADVSKITGFSINNRSKTELTNQDRVQIKFKVQNVSRRQLCSFWDFDRNVWSDEGCEEIEVGEDYVVCECNHLTNFAALASTVREVKPNRILSWITIVGCSLSSLGLIATIVCLTGFKALRCRRTTISCNLCGSLLVMNILILGGLERTQNKDVCRVIAMSLHYTLLASFLWMLMEGYFLYQMILVVFSDVLNIKLRWFYLLCYGSPIPIVAITAGSRYNSYISNYYCWLSIEHGVNWSFLGPALIIIFINTVVFVCAMKAASEVRKRKLHNTQAMAAGWLKGSFSMMCLLGLTWITGFFYIKDTKGFEIFLYLFTILNSFQGIFIFIFHVAMNEKARLTILTFWKTRKPKSGSDSSRKTIETIVGGGSCVSNQSNKRFSGSSMSSSFSSRAPIV